MICGICWSAPLLDELNRDQGNLTALANSIVHDHEKLGADQAFSAVVRTASTPPWWLLSSDHPRAFEIQAQPSNESTLAVIALCALLISLFIAGVRSRRWDVVTGLMISSMLLLAVAAVTSSTPSEQSLWATLNYGLHWASIAGLFIWLMIGWSAASMLYQRGKNRERLDSRRLQGAGIIGGFTVVVACSLAVSIQSETDDTNRWTFKPLAQIADRLEGQIPSDKTVLVKFKSRTAFWMLPAVMYILRNNGHQVTSDDFLNTPLGTSHDARQIPSDFEVSVSDGYTSNIRDGRIIGHVPLASLPPEIFTKPPKALTLSVKKLD